MKKINEGFVCKHCERNIEKASQTCRNHCSYCFLSLHVDTDTPGDRKANCAGWMIPFSYELRNGTYKIRFICTECHKEHWNKVAKDDEWGDLDKWIQYWKKKYLHVVEIYETYR